MKFNIVASAFILSASTVLAGTFNKPVSGQTLSVEEPFAFNYTTDKYFKQVSRSISVLLTPGKFATNKYGLVMKADMKSNGAIGGLDNYYVDALMPVVSPGGLLDGPNYQVVVIEKFTAWGGADAISFDAVDVVMEA